MKKLFLDDIRNPSLFYSIDDDFHVSRTYDDAVEFVKSHGIPDFISFDHDLGDINPNEKTGYTFAKFLIEYMIDNDCLKQFKYVVHSANPVGKNNIEKYLENAFSILM